jgi:hypothetical protein
VFSISQSISFFSGLIVCTLCVLIVVGSFSLFLLGICVLVSANPHPLFLSLSTVKLAEGCSWLSCVFYFYTLSLFLRTRIILIFGVGSSGGSSSGISVLSVSVSLISYDMTRGYSGGPLILLYFPVKWVLFTRITLSLSLSLSLSLIYQSNKGRFAVCCVLCAAVGVGSLHAMLYLLTSSLFFFLYFSLIIFVI